MNSDLFLITHYVDDIPSNDGWKQLLFFTYKDGKHYHFFSSREVDLAQLMKKRPGSGIQQLNPPLQFNNTFCLWLSEKGHIYVANKNNPFVGKIVLLSEPSKKLNYIHPKEYLENLFNRKGDLLFILSKVKESFEWEKVLSTLSICISIIDPSQLNKNTWIYTLLCYYEKRYGRLFHLYCNKIGLKFNEETAILSVDDKVFFLPSSITKEEFKHMMSLMN